MWARKQEYQYYIGQMMINCILKYFVIYQKGINKPLRIRCSMQISYCFIKSNVNSVLVLVGVSKVFFHNDSPFFDRVMSSSRNVWAVLRIQQICNTTRLKFPIYGLFRISKRQSFPNYIQNIQTIFPEALGFRDFYLSTRSGTHFPIYRNSLINSIILTEIKII